MGILVNPAAEQMNKAIMKKVESVLANTKVIDSLRIAIEGKRGESVTIRYDITEFITTEADDETN